MLMLDGCEDNLIFPELDLRRRGILHSKNDFVQLLFLYLVNFDYAGRTE